MDNFPAGGTGAGITYDILGEIEYEIDAVTNPAVVGDIIDGSAISAISYYRDNFDANPYTMTFEDGTSISSSANAKDMQNGTTITMEPEGWVTYYHILLDRHEVIYAEGAETESFFPDEASLNSMAKKTREELAKTVDLSTFGRTVRPTLSANQAMYLTHNMDLLEEDADQIAAQ